MKNILRKYLMQKRVMIFSLITLTFLSFLYFYNNKMIPKLLIGNYLDDLTKSVGLNIKHIEISGMKNANSVLIEKKLASFDGKSIFLTSITDIKKQIEKIDWVKSVDVKRQLPDKIIIQISERVPFAIWQNDNKLLLISNDGEIITDKILNNFSDYPIVIGPDAHLHVEELLRVIESDNELFQRVSAATRIGMRRWNILIDNRISILLPEENYESAWKRLIGRIGAPKRPK